MSEFDKWASDIGIDDDVYVAMPVAEQAWQAATDHILAQLGSEEVIQKARMKFREERKFRLGFESEGDADVRAMRAALTTIKDSLS